MAHLETDRHGQTRFVSTGKATPLLLLILGIVMLALGGYKLYSKYTFQKFGVSARAEVIEMREQINHEAGKASSTTYAPTFQFVSSKGETITIEYNVYASPPDFETGDRVTVYYMPENPNHIELGFMQMDTVIFGALTIGGLVLLIVSIVKFRKAG